MYRIYKEDFQSQWVWDSMIFKDQGDRDYVTSGYVLKPIKTSSLHRCSKEFDDAVEANLYCIEMNKKSRHLCEDGTWSWSRYSYSDMDLEELL